VTYPNRRPDGEIARNVTVRDLSEFSASTQEGDSGGPMYAGHAYGIVSGRRTVFMVCRGYQGLWNAEDNMNVNSAREAS
jgi:hypothetical protein